MLVLSVNAGLNHNAFRLQLEALLHNPGLKPDMVHVSVPVLHSNNVESKVVYCRLKTQFNCVCLGDV